MRLRRRLTTYSTPRRLAVLVEDVLAGQADTEEQLTGPSWNVAFKDGAPTAAAQAFAKKAGVAVAALEKVTNAKGEYVGATVKRLGRAAAELLAAELPKEVLGIYWAKNMYWRAGKPERFVRPVRWVVALLDAAVVPLEIAGIAAGNASRGHRSAAWRPLRGSDLWRRATQKCCARHLWWWMWPSAGIRFARRWMRRRAQLPGRAGARTRRWWRRWCT